MRVIWQFDISGGGIFTGKIAFERDPNYRYLLTDTYLTIITPVIKYSQ